ncbi:putative ABC transport system permease protein [Marinobacterium halophilum]|uniref:Putative ABC transport system permease protein n=1 Tax=Marinobacterium halophilum TaxID=267374 RepID=A0A2P8EY60_9GAMM|nr:FtsX-like permease family protein [Marinobacterium halophilum]PSL14401.1 putative ABC transport system permease protein [Marinobacterium halophilum]
MSLLTRLAARQLLTQLRTTEWRALLLASWIAIALTTLLAVLGDRLERGLMRESASLLGADLVLSSSRPLTPERLQGLPLQGIQQTPVIQFPSMVGQGDNLMLVSVRALQAPYPLRGELVTEPAGTGIPAPGEVWVEPRVMTQLQLQPGAQLEFGYQPLTVSRELLASPDRGTGFRSFSPHILVNAADLDASGVLAPGSRANYRILFAGSSAAVRTLDQALRPTLASHERIHALQADQPLTGNALGNALSYLKLSALIALLLSALTIMLALRRFSLGQHTRSALLLNLGLRPGQLVRVYLYQLLLAWLLTASAGILTGFLLESAVYQWLAELLPQALPPAHWLRWLSGAALGLALLVLLGLPPILQLARIPVAHLLRGDAPPRDRTALLLQGASMILLAATLLAFLEAPLAALGLLAFLLLGGALFGWLAQGCLLLCARPLARHLLLGRLLLMRLRQQRQWHRLQAAVVVMLLTLLSVVWVSRTDLIEQWQAQFPSDTPNYFLINIQPWQKAELDTFFAERALDTELYPMIRGRLTQLNGNPIQPQLNAEQQDHNTLRRELNLSWRAERPAHNPLVAGDWWQPGDTDAISIEQDMARELGLELGDRLGFDIGGIAVEGVIRNIREVVWTSFQPNFYIIFNPEALQNAPSTWITSFHLPAEQRALSRDLLQQFPSLTLIDIDQVLTQLAGWLQRLGDSSALILALSLGCGLLLLGVTLLQALEQRRFESALLQTLGVSAEQARRLDLLEFLLIGLVCGGLASASAEGVLAMLHQWLLQIPPRLHGELWLLLPPLAAMVFVLIGWLIRRPLRLDQCYRLLRAG